MNQQRDAYKVLQVDPEADLEVIQAAYRRLAQKYHPDRAASQPDAEAAALRMVEINAAWDQLRDPGRRRSYDHQRAELSGQASSGSAPTHGFSSASAGSASSQPSHSSTSSGPAQGERVGRFEELGEAGPAPGRPSGSVLDFGRYRGWSLGEIGRADPDYLEWLDRTPIGRPFRQELDALLRLRGSRGDPPPAEQRRGLLKRR